MLKAEAMPFKISSIFCIDLPANPGMVYYALASSVLVKSGLTFLASMGAGAFPFSSINVNFLGKVFSSPAYSASE